MYLCGQGVALKLTKIKQKRKLIISIARCLLVFSRIYKYMHIQFIIEDLYFYCIRYLFKLNLISHHDITIFNFFVTFRRTKATAIAMVIFQMSFPLLYRSRPNQKFNWSVFCVIISLIIYILRLYQNSTRTSPNFINLS